MYYKLTFATNLGSTIIVNVPRAREITTPGVITYAVGSIIDSNAIKTKDGSSLTACKNAALVKTTAKEFNML